MKTTFLTRTDEVGEGLYDSIAWAYEVHVKKPHNQKAQFAVLYGNEDSPDKIEFFEVYDYIAKPIEIWTNKQENG